MTADVSHFTVENVVGIVRAMISPANPQPKMLYSMEQVAQSLGVTKAWISKQVGKSSAPPPDFQAQIKGGKIALLWTEVSMDRWRAFRASVDPIAPRVRKYSSYSDHNAVNAIAGSTITWKLWSRPMCDGGTLWWFSTPRGWYASNNDGVTWDFTDTMIRPVGYRYSCVNGSVTPTTSVAAILRSAGKLRRELEGQ